MSVTSLMIVSLQGVLDENGTRIEQVEALALRVLLRLRSWLGDDGHIAAGRYPVTLSLDEHLARELLMPRHPLHVGMNRPLDHDVKPRVELIGAAAPDLDPGRQHWLEPAGQVTAEHVLERLEPVAPPGQQGGDSGVSQVGELDLHGGTAGEEGPSRYHRARPSPAGRRSRAPRPC